MASIAPVAPVTPLSQNDITVLTEGAIQLVTRLRDEGRIRGATLTKFVTVLHEVIAEAMTQGEEAVTPGEGAPSSQRIVVHYIHHGDNIGATLGGVNAWLRLNPENTTVALYARRQDLQLLESTFKGMNYPGRWELVKFREMATVPYDLLSPGKYDFQEEKGYEMHMLQVLEGLEKNDPDALSVIVDRNTTPAALKVLLDPSPVSDANGYMMVRGGTQSLVVARNIPFTSQWARKKLDEITYSTGVTGEPKFPMNAYKLRSVTHKDHPILKQMFQRQLRFDGAFPL